MNDSLMARYFAIGAHRNQLYGDQPYVVHLDAVAGLLREVGIAENSPTHVAAYLHDVMEDCEITKQTIARLFGPSVADIVELVTDKPGNNRRERHEATYLGIFRDRRATTVKLADRVANVRASLGDEARLRMYSREHPRFVRLLKGPEKDQFPAERALWNILDGLL